MNEVLQIHRRFCDYCLVFKGNTKQTIRWYQESIKYLVEHSKAEKINGITKRTVEDWLLWGKLERDWAPKTIRNRLQSLSLFFAWCVQEKYIPENPVANIPKPKLPKRIPKHLSKDEALKLLDWAKHFRFDYTFERKRAIAIIGMFIFTGLRREELRALKMNDVNFTERTVFVESGKGRKDRIVPIHPQLLPILRAYWKQRLEAGRPSSWFFTGVKSDRQLQQKDVQRICKKVTVSSGVKFSAHILRHTFAREMVDEDFNIFKLKEIMGHAQITTTQIYMSVSRKGIKNSFAKVRMF